MRTFAGIAAALLVVALAPQPPLGAAITCGTLTALSLPHTRITLAQPVDAGPFT